MGEPVNRDGFAIAFPALYWMAAAADPGFGFSEKNRQIVGCSDCTKRSPA